MATGEREVAPPLWPVEARLAALLPDLLVFRKPRRSKPELATAQGVLLGVHVTGFTALMDRLSLTCKSEHDMDKLAHIFSYYISDIVEHVLCFGGDILNITGNVLLALWTVKQNQLSDIITLVAKCSLEIQEKFGIYHTREGQDLQLKIGLSAGRISQVIVGDEQRQYFLVIGRDVDDVRLAQRLAQANEIVLSWNCWKLCEQYMFEVEIMREDEAVKLRDMRIIDPFDFDEHFDKCLNYLPHYRTSTETLRTALELDPDSALEQTLRKHIMTNLLKKIDEGQPMEYVSELRTVTVVLISLEFHKTTWVLHLCHLIQEAALYISTVIEKGGGQLSRIFMFEKGCMFLCVFGLPGHKKPDECAHALESSFRIFTFCWENLTETKLVSISITNGPVFCGVVGAVARHEYTVIGPKVSLVTRMITAYPGLVSCDEVTYLRSMLPAYSFKKLPEKMMKNISNPGKMYEYLGHRRCVMFGKRHLARKRNKNHPLLDREKELEAFRVAQQGCLHQKKGQAVLYEGGKGCGKSQLLAEINCLAQKEGYRVLPLELKEADSKQCFYAIQTLMAIFFEIDTCPGCYRQECLHRQLRGIVEEPLHCLFNDLFFVKDILLFHDLQKEEEENTKWETLSANAMKSALYSIVPTSCEDQELYVCTVKDDVNLDTVLLPLLLKEIAINQLDQLSSEEQLLLKCAAVIGHSFHLDLLQHLLPGWNKNKLFQVLRALVDIHVLHWLNKDQELPAEPIVVQSSVNIIDQTKEEKSGAGLASLRRLQEELFLPPTEVLEFGVPLLREAAWELWPKEQQIALHLECACFLQDLACRCGSCCGGDFVPFHRYAVCSTKHSSGTSRFCTYKDTGSVLTQAITDKLQPPSPQDSLQFQEETSRSQKAFSSEPCRTEGEFLDQVNKKLAQPSSEKHLLTMKPCHCEEILKLVLSPLTQHCLVIGETTCAFYYLLEAAAASLDLSDNYMAFFYLRKASSLRGQPSAFSFLKKHNMKICQFEEATFCRLRSEVCFNMGQITLAKKLAREALRLLKRHFPWTWFGVFFKTFLEKYWYSCSLTQRPSNPRENSKKKLAVLQQRVHCLSLLWQLYSLEATASNRRFASLATLMQKNSAEEFANEAQVVSTYVDLSQYSQNMGNRDKWLHCEKMAIEKSSLCWFSREGLLAMAQLMQALAYTKLCLGHLDFSIKLGFQAHEICRYLKKPALENLVLSILFRAAFLKKKFDLCVHVLESQWGLISQGHDVLGLACFYSACLDLLLYGKGLLCRSFGECLRFIQHYEHSCVLSSQSNVMLGVHSSLAMWFAQDLQWDLFEYHFSKACQLVKRTNASLFGSHGFVRFLECRVLMLQKMPGGVFTRISPENHSQTLKYFKEFFSRCVTCPVYHQWVSELKASVMRYGKRESMFLTNIIRPLDTCLTKILIEEEFLEENNPSGRNLGLQRFNKVADVKENKGTEETQECVC
ncbi:adenylate cyclase type 10 isoform X10 [Oryctolagus cuniculus]|uniref:adenylate cyclase type 10 isoform X10 n=1 Tax=Oryctolagus cuniculus TaxID=9986 RepID=UPI0004901C69|nr:adenylate cyclase type 10 isoform X10 [Oryctolagus cuniculus]